MTDIQQMIIKGIIQKSIEDKKTQSKFSRGGFGE